MEKKSINELSIEEILEQLELKKGKGRQYAWHLLVIKLFELTEKLSDKNFNEIIISNKRIKLNFHVIFPNICRNNYSLSLSILNSILDKELKEKIIVQSFGEIFKLDSQKAVELLNTISSKELQYKTISKAFRRIFKSNYQEAIELLNSISSKELKDEIISEIFEQIFYIDSQKAIELLKTISSKELQGKTISKNFEQIFKKNFEKAIELLNSILSKELQDKIILDFFGRFFYKDSQKAIELLNSISSKELQDKIILDFFGRIFKIDSKKALELLNGISSEELQDKTILEDFRQIFQRDYQKFIELLNSISSKELQNKIISKFFGRIFKRDYPKSIELLDSISSEELRDKIISKFFERILKKDSQKAIELINSISSKKLKENFLYDFERKIFILDNGYIKMKSINHYMSFALKHNIIPNIDLVEEIENRDFKNSIIETFFNDFMQKNRILSIKLLSQISDNRLQEKIAINYLLKYNLIDMELLTFCSKNIIKEKFIPLKIDNLNNIQKNINTQNKSNAIFKAHREVQKEDNSTLELEELSVNRLSFLIIHEEEESNFNRLLNEFSKRVQKEGENYSELIFETIRDSKIQNDVLLELEAYIDKRAVINSLKNLKKDRTSQKSVNEILETVLKSTKKRNKDKEKYFLYLFRRKHDIKTIHAVIPQIAIKDFGLAKRLLNRVQDKKLKEKAQKEMFLNLHENLEEMMYAYKRVEDFHTKERLSKIALAHYLPTFTNSFFHKSLSALDSQNIINTLDELSTVAPREVLKYYKEIKDDIGDRVDEVIEKIKELKSEREKAENLEDEELFDKVEIEAQKLKDEILEDRELIEAFITRVGITEFRFKRGLLLDLA